MAQSSVNDCGVCEKNNGISFCRDCEGFLCRKCKSLHDKFPANNQHIVDAITVGRPVLKPKKVCKDHRKEYVYYCNDCDWLICRECIISSHHGHKCDEYMNIVDQLRKNGIKIISEIKQKVQILEELVTKIDTHKLPEINSITNDFDNQVNAVSKELVDVIDSVTKIHKTTASDFKSTETDKMWNVRKFVESVKKAYTDVLLKFEHVLPEQHGVTFYLAYKAIKMEINNLVDIPEIPTVDQFPIFYPDSFTDQIIDELQIKFNSRTLKEKTEEIDKLTGKLEEAKHKIEKQECAIYTLIKEKENVSESFQKEKMKFAKLKKDQESTLRDKTDEIKTLTKNLEEEKHHIEKQESEIATLIKKLQTLQTQFGELEKDHNSTLKENRIEIKKLKKMLRDAERSMIHKLSIQAENKAFVETLTELKEKKEHMNNMPQLNYTSIEAKKVVKTENDRYTRYTKAEEKQRTVMKKTSSIPDKFGCSKIEKDLIDRMAILIRKEPHHLLRRETLFSHRDMHFILDLVEQKKTFYLYTVYRPSSKAMHLGQLVLLMITKWLQDTFDVQLVIQMTDVEKFLNNELTIEDTNRLIQENAKDIIACGFNDEKTFIFSDLEHISESTEFYKMICRIQKLMNFHQSKEIFGFNESDSIRQIGFPASQAAPSFSSAFPQIFKGKRDVPCLILCDIDQVNLSHIK